MSATATEKANPARARLRSRSVEPAPPWNAVLHDSWHPMSWVVYALVKAIPGTTVKRATAVMWEAHTKGRAVAKTCHWEPAELCAGRLRTKGLTASTEQAE